MASFVTPSGVLIAAPSVMIPMPPNCPNRKSCFTQLPYVSFQHVPLRTIPVVAVKHVEKIISIDLTCAAHNSNDSLFYCFARHLVRLSFTWQQRVTSHRLRV